MNPTKPKSNGSAAASTPPPIPTTHHSRLNRTLWGAAIGALVAMFFVPVVKYSGYGRTLAERRVGGYYELLIARSGNTDIDVSQLVLNVVFASLVGAVSARMSKRAWLWIGGTAALLAIAAGIIIIVRIRQDAVVHAESDERYADKLLRHATTERDITAAKQYLLNAAKNWRIAGNKTKEESVKAREKNFRLPTWDDVVEWEEPVSRKPVPSWDETKAEIAQTPKPWKKEHQNSRSPSPTQTPR